MPSKRTAVPSAKSVTAERAVRLYRLVQLVGRRPQTRAELMRRLGLDIRGFYRDLEALRQVGIVLALRKQRYALAEDAAQASARLPFPDPGLTVGEAAELARGRTAGSRKIKALLAQLRTV
jgi:DNA-binding transcriptional ArsR family regulator